MHILGFKLGKSVFHSVQKGFGFLRHIFTFFSGNNFGLISMAKTNFGQVNEKNIVTYRL